MKRSSHFNRRWATGLAGLVAVALPCVALAQTTGNAGVGAGAAGTGATGAGAAGTTGTTAGYRGRVGAGMAGMAGQDTQILIGHAVGMAIDGSTLQGIAQLTEEGGHHKHAGHHQGSAEQLRQHARTAFDGSNRLLREAYRDVSGSAGATGRTGTTSRTGATDTSGTAGTTGAAGTPAAGRTTAGGIAGTTGVGATAAGGGAAGATAAGGGAASRRLYTAAVHYVTTLESLAGVASERTSGAHQGSHGGQSATAHEGAGGGGQGGASSADLDTVTLINHAVKEALDATQLEQMTTMMASGGTAGQQLLQHAREMASESQQGIQRIMTAEGGTSHGGHETAGGHHGQGSVHELAMAGRDVIQALQAGGAGMTGTRGGAYGAGAGTSGTPGRGYGAGRAGGAGGAGGGTSGGAGGAGGGTSGGAGGAGGGSAR